MKKLIVLLLLMIGASAEAQSRVPFLEAGRSADRLTGVLSQDLFPGATFERQSMTGHDLLIGIAAQPESLSHRDSLYLLETRSSLKAGLFSLVVPGAGQVYNGGTVNYITAAGFLAIEAAAIAVNIIWINKGNNQTTFFQNYADANYSVLRYAQWIKLNFNSWDPNPDQATQNLLNEMFVNDGPAPWQKVDFGKLNEIESILGQTTPGQFFTHKLPPYGDQQYYELIGKYPQFREGWNPAAATDTVVTYEQLKYGVEVGQDNYYMGQRGLANNLYAVAGTAIGVVIANHFLSAIEAAIWAHAHNKLVQTSVDVTPLPQGLGYQTRVNVAVNL
ncbi:MAG TPA: hypothetical protein VLX91_11955 [Candidatus Acidoferrales bacterium]|nr:hypothetical protein [Candidatus Acidoferrales bacterium]